jgi:hypothetical protein
MMISIEQIKRWTSAVFNRQSKVILIQRSGNLASVCLIALIPSYSMLPLRTFTANSDYSGRCYTRLCKVKPASTLWLHTDWFDSSLRNRESRRLFPTCLYAHLLNKRCLRSALKKEGRRWSSLSTSYATKRYPKRATLLTSLTNKNKSKPYSYQEAKTPPPSPRDGAQETKTSSVFSVQLTLQAVSCIGPSPTLASLPATQIAPPSAKQRKCSDRS